MKFIGTIATDFSGSIGGITASRNRGGGYFRQRVVPVNPNTFRQSLIRTIFQDLQSTWTNILTPGARLAWDNYSLQTPGFVGGGMQAYIAMNTPRIYADTLFASTLGRIDVAPLIFDSGSFTPIVPTTTAPSAISLAYTNTDSWAIADGGALYISAGAAVNASRTNYFGRYHMIGVVEGAVVPPVSPEAAVSDLPFLAGQQIFVSVRASQPDGRLSAPQRYPTIAL